MVICSREKEWMEKAVQQARISTDKHKGYRTFKVFDPHINRGESDLFCSVKV